MKMNDEQIKNILKNKKLIEPEFEWTRIKGRITSEHKALKMSISGLVATLLIVITINVYNQRETTNGDDLVNYMLEDGYLSADSTYDYIDF
jgi:hypothetical protein